ncbi:MAG: hypothetical protein KDK36_20860 [Leptospiraceae bacterium]|nr:hypothetical protein [Leptospiraceae bacterium]
MKKLYLLITILLTTYSCNPTDESTKCVNEFRDEINSRPFSCGTGLVLGQYLILKEMKLDPNSRSNPNSAGNILTNIGILLCLEELERDKNCRNKSHIIPTNQKGNLLGY